jgi:hypothetical protein
VIFRVLTRNAPTDAGEFRDAAYVERKLRKKEVQMAKEKVREAVVKKGVAKRINRKNAVNDKTRPTVFEVKN